MAMEWKAEHQFEARGRHPAEGDKL